MTSWKIKKQTISVDSLSDTQPVNSRIYLKAQQCTGHYVLVSIKYRNFDNACPEYMGQMI